MRKPFYSTIIEILHVSTIVSQRKILEKKNLEKAKLIRIMTNRNAKVKLVK